VDLPFRQICSITPSTPSLLILLLVSHLCFPFMHVILSTLWFTSFHDPVMKGVSSSEFALDFSALTTYSQTSLFYSFSYLPPASTFRTSINQIHITSNRLLQYFTTPYHVDPLLAFITSTPWGSPSQVSAASYGKSCLASLHAMAQSPVEGRLLETYRDRR
jgi:hypothetical protein